MAMLWSTEGGNLLWSTELYRSLLWSTEGFRMSTVVLYCCWTRVEKCKFRVKKIDHLRRMLLYLHTIHLLQIYVQFEATFMWNAAAGRTNGKGGRMVTSVKLWLKSISRKWIWFFRAGYKIKDRLSFSKVIQNHDAGFISYGSTLLYYTSQSFGYQNIISQLYPSARCQITPFTKTPAQLNPFKTLPGVLGQDPKPKQWSSWPWKKSSSYPLKTYFAKKWSKTIICGLSSGQNNLPPPRRLYGFTASN